MKQLELQKLVAGAIVDVGGHEFREAAGFEVAPAQTQFGDYATNAALVYAKRLGRHPRELAEQIAAALRTHVEVFQRVEVAGPGFINLTLTDEVLLGLAKVTIESRPQLYKDKVIVAEYSDPNPFKVLHAGHLYTTLVGDSIARLLEIAGATVYRTNFGGDVGLHVARSLWGMVQELGGENSAKMAALPLDLAGRMEWVSRCYVNGTAAYETDEVAKKQIMDYNARVYEIHRQDDHESPLAKMYWIGREWSYEYFKGLYDQLGVEPFDKYYPESLTTPFGEEQVAKGLEAGIFERSDGATVYRGEDEGLHTRVFLTSQGLPTYEAKDLGLIFAKWQDYRFDESVIITGNDIVEYMKVVQAAIVKLEPALAGRTVHLTHSMIRLAGGVKISSRKGNGLKAVDILESARLAAEASPHGANPASVLAAVKYAFLRQRIGGGDIIYDPAESVSLEGNSGPYLQYAHARARSIIGKSGGASIGIDRILNMSADERVLIRKLVDYRSVIEQAAHELMPHLVCTYLYELAQTFNRFYERNRVIGDEREVERLSIVQLYADVLKDGLDILGIEAPNRL